MSAVAEAISTPAEVDANAKYGVMEAIKGVLLGGVALWPARQTKVCALRSLVSLWTTCYV